MIFPLLLIKFYFHYKDTNFFSMFVFIKLVDFTVQLCIIIEKNVDIQISILFQNNHSFTRLAKCNGLKVYFSAVSMSYN